MSSALPPDVRHQLSDALQRSPAFHRMSPHEQARMAENLESVMGVIASPSDAMAEGLNTPVTATEHMVTEGERAAARIAEARSNARIAAEQQRTAREVAGRQYDLDRQQLSDQYTLKNQEMSDTNRGRAAMAAGRVFSDMTQHVDFGSFVKSLISNVYDAIVHSSIEQMQSYAQLLESVAGPASRFAGQISNNEAAQYLVSMFPAALQMVDGMPAAKDDDTGNTDFSTKLPGAPKNVDLSETSQIQQLVDLAKLKMAKQNQHLLATMVMMGIDRIVVTDGSINARVKIHAAGQNSYTSENLNQQRSIGGGVGLPTASGSDLGQSARITVGTGVGEGKTQSTNYVRDDAELYGAVSVNFKSQVMPLDDIADDQTRAKLKGKQKDGQQRYSGRGRAPSGPPGSRGSSAYGGSLAYGRRAEEPSDTWGVGGAGRAAVSGPRGT